jgi:hypothetical protein
MEKRPVVQLPPLTKRIEVTIDESITDVEILAVVSALVCSRHSAQLKHDSLCIQQHVRQELNFSMGLHIPQSMVEKGLPELLATLLDCEHSINQSSDLPVDFTQTLDYDTIYKLAQPSGRSFAQAAGILIGAEAPSVFDIRKATEGSVKQCFYDQAMFLDQHLLGKYPAIPWDGIKLLPLFFITEENGTYQEMLQDVVNSSLVVGPLSFQTYAACCLEIPCIEIFKSQEQLNMFSKWSALKYTAILEEEMHHVKRERIQTVWKHWQALDNESKVPVEED